MTTTAFVTTVIVIALGIYDLVMVAFFGIQSSVSAFMIEVGFKSPAFVFMGGFLAGHLFGYMEPVKPK